MSANVRSKQRTSRGAINRNSRALGTTEEVIRRRAYQLYVEGGRREGHAREDWLQAEREVLAAASRRGIREDFVVH
jgi:Protein of unknown function (DUF2934)